MKLKFNAIQILVADLLPDEIGVIYMMGLQKQIRIRIVFSISRRLLYMIFK